MNQQLAELARFGFETTSLHEVALQLSVGVMMSLLIWWHFARFASVLSNRDEMGKIFPFVLLSTLLVINVVKSSLALSLGLVGALSIVRFRTAIKEPEELAYLFLTIACGLGLGAGQLTITVGSTFVILLVMACVRGIRSRPGRKNLYLSISLEGAESQEMTLEALNQIVAEHVDAVDLRRVDDAKDHKELTYFVCIADTGKLSQLSTAMRERFPDAALTFIDQGRIPGL